MWEIALRSRKEGSFKRVINGQRNSCLNEAFDNEQGDIFFVRSDARTDLAILKLVPLFSFPGKHFLPLIQVSDNFTKKFYCLFSGVKSPPFDQKQQ